MSAKGNTPSKLVAAIRAGRLSGVISALDDGCDIEEADIHGFRGLPLRTACFAGEMAIIRELLRCGANVNAMAGDGPGAPLRLALRGGHPVVAALLLQNGAEIPPGLKIDPGVLSSVGNLAPLPGEAPVPTLPESPPANMIEFTSPVPDQTIEEVDLKACFGTDTNLLTMDLMRFNEDEATKTPSRDQERTTPAKGFWKTGQR